ncbi:DUF6705 family protein [Winogradskyella sp. SYSU M77433]|uniref:DUF6705 family protein n=1 Tax=Winogradskyella sp. SYSU M77433 TaxID=3042722 RepID=UPI0024806DBF|nr:DUF6705 family protein [Winogradskyella sp. SYSU M77433]MDH7913166.1 hypothetical protein [Winogradskyella sp. SYSU M77433]
MKTIINIQMLFFSLFLTAQETVIPLENDWHMDNPVDNVYYKDVNNILDKYIGDWVIDDGTHYLKLQIEKQEHILIGGGSFKYTNYEDRLIVKFVYKLNGVEQYNTLSGTRLFISGSSINSNNIVNLQYREPSLINCFRTIDGSLSLEFIPDGTLTPIGEAPSGMLHWNRTKDVFGHRPIDGSCEDTSDFIIPYDLTLERE